MTISLNKVILMGHLGSDPEIKEGQYGKFAILNLATTEYSKDREGKGVQNTEWHRITVFKKALIPIIETHLSNGDRLYVEGSLATNKFTEGTVTRYSTQIEVKAFEHNLKFDAKKELGDDNDDAESEE